MDPKSKMLRTEKIFAFILIAVVLTICFSANIKAELSPSVESSSVSRIVGESPNELLRQMSREELNIDYATYYTHHEWNNKKDDILDIQFGDHAEGNIQGTEDWFADYSWDDVQESVDNFHENQLFIVEATMKKDLMEVSSTDDDDTIIPFEMRQWEDSFMQNNPLFVFDAPYAGAYNPKLDNYVSRLVRDSTIIAPTSFSTVEFPKSVICQLLDDKTVGELFKDARNFHYNGGSHADHDNFIGLVLQSYALYGNPRQKINMNFNDFDEIRSKCKNYLENLATDIEFLGDIDGHSVFRKHIVFQIPNYEVAEEGIFHVLDAENAYQRTEYDEILLPYAIRTTHFPKNSVILNYTLDYVGNAADITIEDLPILKNNLTNRTCYENTSNYSIEFWQSLNEESLDFVANILPVDIIDCEAGDLRLYRQINYSIDYIPFTPALVNYVDPPVSKYIHELITVPIEIMPLQHNVTNISLAVYDQDNNILWDIETDTSVTEHTAEFYAPEYEGLQEYSVEIIVDGQTVNYYPFSIFITILEPQANIPLSVDLNPTVNLNFKSYLPTGFDANVEYFLKHDETILEEGDFTKSIVQGDNPHQLSFTDLTREDQAYTLTLEMDYLGQKQTITYLLTTNNVPLLYVEPVHNYRENDTVNISFSAIDYDDDPLTITSDDPRFVLEGDSFIWQTDFVDEGEYTFTITAEDDLLSTEKQVTVYVKHVLYCGDLAQDYESLDRNLVCTGDAIHINADNVTLNCDGYSIVGDGSGNGIRIQDSNNAQVMNCNISQFEHGISLQNTHDSEFINNKLLNNVLGVNLTSGTGNLFYYNNFSNNTHNAHEYTSGNDWNSTSDGNYWSDFEGNPGYPEYYEVLGDGDGVDWKPLNEVIEVNEPPILDYIGPRTLDKDVLFVLDVNATDPDNDTLTYYTNANIVLPTPDVWTFDSVTGVFEWIPGYPDVYNITFNVTDGEYWDEEEVMFTVNDVIENQPPILEEIGPQEGRVGQMLMIDMEASDPDNDTLTYHTTLGEIIPQGDYYVFNDTTGELEWIPSEAGEYVANFWVFDGELSDSEVVTINITQGDTQSPEISNLVVNAGIDTVNISWDTDEPANATIIYGLAPDNMNVSTGRGTFLTSHYFTLRNLLPETTYYFNTTACDDNGNCGTYGVFDFTTIINQTNQPPVITSTPSESATTLQLYEYQAEADDPENDSLTWFLIQGPENMTIELYTGLLQWTPSIPQAGTHEISISVCDGDLSDEQTWNITVREAWQDLIVTDFFKVYPDQPNQTDDIQFYYEIFNNGTFNGPNLYFQIDTDGDTGFIVNEEPINVPLQTSYYGFVHWNYSLPGIYYPTFFIDYNGQYEEINEDNNEITIEVEIGRTPSPPPSGSPVFMKPDLAKVNIDGGDP